MFLLLFINLSGYLQVYLYFLGYMYIERTLVPYSLLDQLNRKMSSLGK